MIDNEIEIDIEFEFDLNLKEEKKYEKKSKEKLIKRKNSKGRYILPNKIKIMKPNLNLNENISSTNRKRIRDLKEKNEYKNKLEKKRINSIRQMMERIYIDKKNNYSLLNQNEKNNRKIKIISDISSSEISENLIKNYFPCIIPSYYPNQIKTQIDKIKNFDLNRKINLEEKGNKLKKEEIKLYKFNLINSSNEININKNNKKNNLKKLFKESLREFVEKNCEFEDEKEYYINIEKNKESENEIKSIKTISEEAYDGDIENNYLDDGENYYDFFPENNNNNKMDIREYDYYNFKKQYLEN
jgi:hypothetical protein